MKKLSKGTEMGLNIFVKRNVGKKTYTDIYGSELDEVCNPAMEGVEWWDDGRKFGDTLFWVENEFVPMEQSDKYSQEGNTDCMDYSRPKDFSTARKWVKGRLREGTGDRLLDALDRLEKDKDLYFQFTW